MAGSKQIATRGNLARLLHEAGNFLREDDLETLDRITGSLRSVLPWSQYQLIKLLLRALPRAYHSGYRFGTEYSAGHQAELVRGLRERITELTLQLDGQEESFSSLENRIASLSSTDAKTQLTNLPNFITWADQGFRNEKRYIRFVLLFIDLQNFKWANDNLGMPVGDKIIVRFAELLRNQFRADERINASLAWSQAKLRIARYGNGDEFVVGFTTGSYGAGERLIQRFDDHLHAEDWTTIHSALADHSIDLHRAAVSVKLGDHSVRAGVSGFTEQTIALASDLLNEDKRRNKNGEERRLVVARAHVTTTGIVLS